MNNLSNFARNTIASVSKGAANAIGDAVTGFGKSSLGNKIIGGATSIYNKVGGLVGRDNLDSAMKQGGEFLRDNVFKPLTTRAAGVLGKDTVSAIGDGLR